MHFIEILLELSVFTFTFSFIPVIFLKNNKINNIMATVEVVSIVLILICLVLYICNALMTCITIWFGNW
ncbi:hypothetical protein PM004_14060 [Clostridium paraputrificum]|uniref:hypothetical protein n=1 Tax=Clostridium paraputrificum TaxID=29363 RepID=UPI002330A7C0|nr:hypothetical protein [Clostridium paraputrificum]MDB2090469.1 hypothetical protein [Clostridium paraputrificum]MDB2097523.1 hypothetical protein [Clostridium paraputrificum]